jgi:hypothetical protein
LPRLKLQRGIELQSPVGGSWSATAKRPLKAEFHFNKKFLRDNDHQKSGSWTRGVQPDYTITVWPAEFSKQEAEACDALVHVHFDAKYRVENVQAMFGGEEGDDPITDTAESEKRGPTAAKYADLLKMHAYRDAIRRSAGAYVLYPGMAGDGRRFVQYDGFHEVLPGLGAFAIRPRSDGTADGMDALRVFLDEVIEHLANRTTARERATFHAAESYVVKEDPVPYDGIVLAERHEWGDSRRALPPAEHHVVVAWYDSPEQLAWTMKQGLANVRLGKRDGTWHIHPEMASAVHVLLRSHRYEVAPGLFRLKKPGYKVFTAEDLKKVDYPGRANGEIYAVFELEPDNAYEGQQWDGEALVKVLKNFEERQSYRKVSDRRLADPRVISLKELLKALA